MRGCKITLNGTRRALFILLMFQQLGLQAALSIIAGLEIDLLSPQAYGPNEVLKEEEQCHNGHLQKKKTPFCTAKLVLVWCGLGDRSAPQSLWHRR